IPTSTAASPIILVASSPLFTFSTTFSTVEIPIPIQPALLFNALTALAPGRTYEDTFGGLPCLAFAFKSSSQYIFDFLPFFGGETPINSGLYKRYWTLLLLFTIFSILNPFRTLLYT